MAPCPKCGKLGKLECLGDFYVGVCRHTGEEICEPYIIFTCEECGYEEEDV